MNGMMTLFKIEHGLVLIALDKMLFFSPTVLIFSYLSMKAYIVGTH